MCGITGIVNCKDTSVIQKMTERISHRGPDNLSIFNFNNISLGHVRLAIQDVSEKANQPYISEDENFIITFNGEIYNNKKVRDKLKSKYSFKTNCDTETLLYGFIEYGKEIVNQLDGIFAFVILNKEKNEITIVRDRMGVKPLYIYQKDDVFSFSSEIKSFLEIPDFDKTINYSALHNYIQFQYSPDNSTPFKFVSKFGKGTILNYDLKENKVSDKKFYIPHFNTSISDFSTSKQSLHSLLKKTIAEQHLSDVPVGYLLSGGLDSSIILHYSNDFNNSKKTFTIDEDGLNNSENFESDLPYAKLVAKKYNSELSISKPILKLRDRLDELIYHLDEPIGDTAILSLDQICIDAKKQNFKVLLSGLGADDIFSGYRRHQALFYQKVKMLSFIIPKIFLPYSLKRRMKKILGKPFEYYSWLNKDISLELFNSDIKDQLVIENNFECIWMEKYELSNLDKMLYCEQEFYLPHNNLLYTDKIGMAHGIEIRVPFLSNRLVEFANSLSNSLKMKFSSTKYLLREIMKGKLPEEVINRKKTGFGYPIRELIMNDDEGLVNDYLLNGNFFKRGVFNEQRVLKLLEDNKNNKIDASYSIWTLICIESWFRQFVD